MNDVDLLTQRPASAGGSGRAKAKWMARLFWLALLSGLLWWALRDVPLAGVLASISRLELWQLGILVGVNALIFGLISARWWVIVHAQNTRVPFLPLLGYRLSAFGLSYFTPGPQVGGEPLQIIYLQKHQGLSYARATASVLMDKLLEFLANFLFLAFGLYAAFSVGLISGSRGQFTGSLIPLAVLFLWPLVHIVLLYRGRHPFSALLRAAGPRLNNLSLARLIIVAEHMAATFCRRHLGALLASLGVSLLSWVGMILEYGLMLRFLDLPLDGLQALAALAAVRLAFLVPLPAGLGALEAAQVFAMTAFGLPAATGISLSLLMRGRDILLGGAGLLLAGSAYTHHG